MLLLREVSNKYDLNRNANEIELDACCVIHLTQLHIQQLILLKIVFIVTEVYTCFYCKSDKCCHMAGNSEQM